MGIDTASTSDPIAELRRLERELGELRARLTPSPCVEAWDSVTWRFVFLARGDRFALPLERVIEVLPMCRLTPYPEASPWLTGLLNWHGRLIVVLDLRARIERQARPINPSDAIVVVRGDDGPLGLVADQALGVEASTGGLQRVPPELPHTPYVAGLFEGAGLATFALDLEALLATSELPEAPG